MTAVSDFAASVTSFVLALSLIFGEVAWAVPQDGGPVRVEVFTAQDLQMQAVRPGDASSAKMMIEVYEIGGIERFETTLSERLPTDPNAARRAALKRVGQVDAVRIEEAQRAAVGLVRAAEYGIDRYPAIVFDGQAVVYGIMGIGEALQHYRVWQSRPPR